MSKSVENVLRQKIEITEQALERSERMAIANRYASAIIHEVNNPLEAIGNLAYLTKLQASDSASVRSNMEIIEKQIEALGRLTHKSLAFHRDHDVPKVFDLVEIVESALKLHEDKITRHQTRVTLDPSGLAMVRVFENEILQVVSNLILNALEAFTDQTGRLAVRLDGDGNEVRLTLSDNGPGIPEGIRSTLFEPYVTSKPSGTGLGLWLSQRIVTRHGGIIQFESSTQQPNHGTSFFVTLPRVIQLL